MQKKLPYRHELKYEISYAEYITLRHRLKYLMYSDPHVGPDGKYQITSLYFDNCNDKALREKIQGVNVREKFRLRRYNTNISLLVLEKKQKINGLCLKTSAPISQECCTALLQGDENWCPEDNQTLLAELDFKMKSQLLRPRTLVAYVREPYIFPPGNVRITFDMDIRTGLTCTDFLKPDVVLIPTMQTGRMILEVKYDAFLPNIIWETLQLGFPRTQAFSKYAACRKYES